MYSILFWTIVFLSLLLVFLVKYRFIPKQLSYPGLFFLVFLSLVLTIYSKPDFNELGLIIPSATGIFLYGCVTLFSCFSIYFLNKHVYKQSTIGNIFKNSPTKLAFYVILSAPAQEFLFRSFLYYSLYTIDLLSILSMVLLSSLMFGIAHLGFKDEYLAKGTFTMGLIWGFAYFIVPDLLLVSVSHVVVGLFAFSQGLIKPQIFFTQAV